MIAPDRAVVIGGSLAGLLAARALQDQYGEVVLVDRDTFPDGAEPRKGVPQARHLHLLLVRGAQILDQLLPGLTDELSAAGAVTVEWPQDLLWLAAAGWSRRSGHSISLLSSRRDLVEACVRRRVFAHERLRVVEATDAIGLVASADGSAVTGVRLRHRADGAEETLEARLVVDTSGRNSKTPTWLTEIGYEAPRQTVIDSFLSTRAGSTSDQKTFEPTGRRSSSRPGRRRRPAPAPCSRSTATAGTSRSPVPDATTRRPTKRVFSPSRATCARRSCTTRSRVPSR